MDEFYIRPTVVGARLADPVTGDLLKPEGEWKPRSTHWLRAELRGDVVAFDPHAEIGGPPEAGTEPASAPDPVGPASSDRDES